MKARRFGGDLRGVTSSSNTFVNPLSPTPLVGNGPAILDWPQTGKESHPHLGLEIAVPLLPLGVRVTVFFFKVHPRGSLSQVSSQFAPLLGLERTTFVIWRLKWMRSAG